MFQMKMDIYHHRDNERRRMEVAGEMQLPRNENRVYMKRGLGVLKRREKTRGIQKPKKGLGSIFIVSNDA